MLNEALRFGGRRRTWLNITRETMKVGRQRPPIERSYPSRRRLNLRRRERAVGPPEGLSHSSASEAERIKGADDLERDLQGYAAIPNSKAARTSDSCAPSRQLRATCRAHRSNRPRPG